MVIRNVHLLGQRSPWGGLTAAKESLTAPPSGPLPGSPWAGGTATDAQPSADICQFAPRGLPSHHGTWGWGKLPDPLGPSKACLLTVGARVVKPPWLGPVTGVQLVVSQEDRRDSSYGDGDSTPPLSHSAYLWPWSQSGCLSLGQVVGSYFWFSVFLIPSANLPFGWRFNPLKFKAIAHKERLISAILPFVSVYLI